MIELLVLECHIIIIGMCIYFLSSIFFLAHEKDPKQETYTIKVINSSEIIL
jgi:hypothetical protein